MELTTSVVGRGNGAERGWDDTQIRDMASFANKNQLSPLEHQQKLHPNSMEVSCFLVGETLFFLDMA